MRAQHLKPRRESGVVISLRQQCTGFAPFPVSPSGGKRGAPPPPLRATARAKRRPKAERFPRSGPVRERALVGRGSRPEPRVLNFMTQTGSLAHKIGQLDVLRT